MTALIIHGHFYQPPRENPWTGQIEREESAAPYHDWNERIHAECYGPNAFAHIGQDVPDRVVNNYSHISFNFGPTLMSWLQELQPGTYQRILDADSESIGMRHGHGNAIAQAYGHAILPLCNQHDQVTQIVWGIADFRYRFGREPESLWLPETAVNEETLSLLIDQGLRYVILAPQQAKQTRNSLDEEWKDVSSEGVDTSRPYRYSIAGDSSRSITVFFYHGALSRAIAFENLLTSSQGLVDGFRLAAQSGHLVNVATDGETYGHHFKFGDLCLAHALEVEAKQAGFWITNYGEYLDYHPAESEVEIDFGPDGEGTSWSCAHGVRRWKRDCGCHTGGETGWNQRWREPLREALELLRDNAASHFETVGGDLLLDPWAARNDYIWMLLDKGASRELFLREHARRPLSPEEESRVLSLMEIQHSSLLMFTSCGWFFSDIAGIETVQVMRYAARVIQLQRHLGLDTPRKDFLEKLSLATSNDASSGNGADIYLNEAESASQPTRQEPTAV